MKKGDRVLFYHSVTDKQVMGVARVEREAYPDPTADDDTWSCVDLVPVKSLKRPVSLEEIKGDKALQKLPLLRQSRLSVMPVARSEYLRIAKLGQTTPA